MEQFRYIESVIFSTCSSPCFLVVEVLSTLFQSTKKIYESLLGDRVNTTTLAHIQVSDFQHYIVVDGCLEKWLCFLVWGQLNKNGGLTQKLKVRPF